MKIFSVIPYQLFGNMLTLAVVPTIQLIVIGLNGIVGNENRTTKRNKTKPDQGFLKFSSIKNAFHFPVFYGSLWLIRQMSNVLTVSNVFGALMFMLTCRSPYLPRLVQPHLIRSGAEPDNSIFILLFQHVVLFILSRFSEIVEDELAHCPLICVSIRMGHAYNMFCALCERLFFQYNNHHIKFDSQKSVLLQPRIHCNDHIYNHSVFYFCLACSNRWVVLLKKK